MNCLINIDCLTCRSDQFQYQQNSKCIDYNLVCNNVTDCSDNSDEPLSCDIDECATEQAGCHHKCVDSKESCKCGCHEGYKLMTDGKDIPFWKMTEVA